MLKTPRIAIVVSQFNAEITNLLLDGGVKYLEKSGCPVSEKDIYRVAGAIEIPLIASLLASSKKVDAIICYGAVIRGETSHYDYVCQQVSYGCQKVALTHQIPVIFGVLTLENEEQGYERCGGAFGHKGEDCAQTALEMITLVEGIRRDLGERMVA